jgi:hypothetical protein
LRNGIVAKVVYASLNPRNGKASRESSLGKKRVMGADGRPKMVRTLDAHSRTFGDDLQMVFQENVRKARRANKRLLGSADGAPAKR